MADESVSLKEYIDALFGERDRAVTAALAASDKRLDGMNEFRQTLKDQQGTYVTRAEVYAMVAAAAAVGGVIGHVWR
jgi:hypothetical protein